MLDLNASLAQIARSDRLRAYVRRRCGDGVSAEDVLQETVLRMMERARTQEIEQPLAYAFRVADSVIYETRRRARPQTELCEDTLACALPGVDVQLEHRQRYARFAETLDRMPEMRRRVFVLRHYDGLSRTEIADLLGLSLEGVKKHLVRAMAELALVMADHDAGEPARPEGRA